MHLYHLCQFKDDLLFILLVVLSGLNSYTITGTISIDSSLFFQIQLGSVLKILESTINCNKFTSNSIKR